MRVRLAATVSLGTVGVLLAHRIGYGLATVIFGESDSLVSHAYLHPLSSILIPLCLLVALAWLIQLCQDSLKIPNISFRELVACQIVLFLIQETLERLPSGTATRVLLDPAVIIGLLAQVVVAYFLARVLRASAQVIRFVLKRRNPKLPTPRGAVVGFSGPQVQSFSYWRGLTTRGPPSFHNLII